MAMNSVPAHRIRRANDVPVNPRGDFVLYWMTANRRVTWNYGLQRAVDLALELGKPLVILEALRIGYPWACERFHGFILEGMADNARRLEKTGVHYYPYVEPVPDADKGLLAALASRVCLIVTDDFPAFFLPRMVASAAKKIPAYFELIDSNGLLPMLSADRVFPTAYAFRRFLQKTLPAFLSERPKADPLRGVPLNVSNVLPRAIVSKWPPASPGLLSGDPGALASFDLNHGVGPVFLHGGTRQADMKLKGFLEKKLSQYPENRNHPDLEGTSGLSSYLHFGHLSVHQVFHQVGKKENWSLSMVSQKTTGGRSGWWGMSEAAEAFLDQLVTWRELGFNMCRRREDYDRYDSLPDWALRTLEHHGKDPRPYLYSLEDFENARTHDPLWNAAQSQLLREGGMHNYLRMLWGKKILEWTPSPRVALDIMIELNNKYALDGRDPNSYSGIFWVLGRYDRAWGPERSVFGKVRYMSSKNTARKLQLRDYLTKYASL